MLAQPLQAEQAKISARVLSVTHRAGSSGDWQKSAVGSRLPAGSRVRTGKRSACEIQFGDGSRVRMGARSDCVIVDPESKRVKVVAGEVFVQIVSGRGGASVEGGTSTAAVRGTWLWFRGPTEPGDEPARTEDEVYVWFGEAEFESPEGRVTLGPGQGATMPQMGGPTAPVAALPPEFGSGRLFPWWIRVRPGVVVQSTPGTSVAEDFKNNESATRTASSAFGLGDMNRGDVGVVVQSAAPLSLGASPFPVSTSILALAPLSQVAPRELGKEFYALPGQVDVAAFAMGDQGFGGIWGRASAISGQYYGELGLQVSTDFKSDPDTFVSDLFIVNRQEKFDVTLGRQRYLLGPVNNSPLGSLFGAIHFDGAAVNYHGQPLSAYGAWVEDFRTPTQSPLHSSGWLARAYAPVLGGQLGVTALRERHEDWGWSADLVLPLLPGYMDTYVEAGVDPQGRKLATFGAYFPSLYQLANMDLYVELAQREHFPSAWTALAYVDAGQGWTGLGGVRKAQGEDWEFAIGATKHFGNLSF